MNTLSGRFSDKKLASLGLLLVLPAFYFVSASILKYGLGIGYPFDALDIFYSNPRRLRIFNLVSPIVFLGSLCLACAFNACAILHLNIRKEKDAFISTITVKAKFWNLAVVGVSALLLATLMGYAFVENFAWR